MPTIMRKLSNSGDRIPGLGLRNRLCSSYTLNVTVLWSGSIVLDCNGRPVRDGLSNMVAGLETELCQELKVGESVPVTRLESRKKKSGDFKTWMYRDFQLRRVDAKTYAVGFSLRFADAQVKMNSDSEIAKKFDLEWKQSVQECMNKAKDFIPGPNGEKIIFELVDVPLLLEQINIQGPKYHTNSSNFASSIKNNCSTILHELVHWAGLLDRYSGQATKTHREHLEEMLGQDFLERLLLSGKIDQKRLDEPLFTCRISTSKNSLMAESYKFNLDQGPQRKSEGYMVCGCAKNRENECAEAWSSPSYKFDRSCPYPFKEYFQKGAGKYSFADATTWQPRPIPLVIQRSSGEKVTVQYGETFLNTEENPRIQPLLRNLEFRMITKPFCPKVLRAYNECMLETYRKDSLFKGEGIECMKLPRRCLDDSWIDEIK